MADLLTPNPYITALSLLGILSNTLNDTVSTITSITPDENTYTIDGQSYMDNDQIYPMMTSSASQMRDYYQAVCTIRDIPFDSEKLTKGDIPDLFDQNALVGTVRNFNPTADGNNGYMFPTDENNRVFSISGMDTNAFESAWRTVVESPLELYPNYIANLQSPPGNKTSVYQKHVNSIDNFKIVLAYARLHNINLGL